jgi:hypothetical protein
MHPPRRHLLTAAFALALLAPALAACGGDARDAGDAASVAQDLGSALHDHSKRTCTLMTPRAQAQVTTMLTPFGDGNNCVGLVGYIDVEEPTVADIQVRGDLAVAKLTYKDLPSSLIVRPGAYGLRRIDGRWRVDNILDATLDAARATRKTGPAAPDVRRRPALVRGDDVAQVRATLAAAREDHDRGAYRRFCSLLSDRADAQVLTDVALALGRFSLGFEDYEPTGSCAERLEALAAAPPHGAGSSDPASVRPLRITDQSSPFALALPSAKRVAAARVSIVGNRASVRIPGAAISPSTGWSPHVKRLVKVDGRWLVDADTIQAKTLSPAEYRRCWKRAGATIATSASDLRFATVSAVRKAALNIGHVSLKGDDWRIFYARTAAVDDPGTANDALVRRQSMAKVLADPGAAEAVAYVTDAGKHARTIARARACGF